MQLLKDERRPVFSVIVPAYNSAAFIDKCIDSVLHQSYSDFELILVDDGSRDDTLDICGAYAKKDVRVKVVHQENGGHTSARNKGLQMSCGKYVLFLDSDDWLELDTLQLCALEIGANCPDIIIYNLYNTGTGEMMRYHVDVGFYDVDMIRRRILDKLLLDANGKYAVAKSLSGKAFKREVLLENQLEIPNEVLVGEDGAAFVGAMLDASSVSIIPKGAYICYVREGSVSRSADSRAFSRLPALLEYYRKKLAEKQVDMAEQFDRFVVAQIYTAVLLVLRSGGGNKELNEGLDSLLKLDFVSAALKNAKFSLRGYKYRIKKFIIRNRMWMLARMLDNTHK